jgi:myb proto-oncogene protein
MFSNTLDPANEKGKWTPEEDAKLTEAVKKHGNNWAAIAAMVHGRTEKQCRPRWTQTLDPANGDSAGKWTPEEDAKLVKAVKNHGKDCWVTVAAMVPGRTNIQCHSRWVQTLNPANMKNPGKWKPEEDAKLTEAVKRLGKKWVAIAALVPGRTNQQCRKRWVRRLDPDRASNTMEEEHNDGNDVALVSVTV